MAELAEVVQKVIEQSAAAEKQRCDVLESIFVKTSYIEQRIERLQKLRRDQFRHLVQFLMEFDDKKGGLYAFLSSIKDVLEHCSFSGNKYEQMVFLWASQLKARGEKLYEVFDLKRQIIKAKAAHTGCGYLDGIESAAQIDWLNTLEEHIDWLSSSLDDAQKALQLALRNSFRPEFLKLIEDLDVGALETKLAEACCAPVGLETVQGIEWYALEAYVRIKNMIEQAQELIEEKHIVEGVQLAPETLGEVFQENLIEPLEPLKPYPFPVVQQHLQDIFQASFKNIVTRTNVEVTEKS